MNNILYTVWLSHDIICYHMMSYLQKASVISWRGNQLDSLASNILQNVFNPPCFWSFCYALLLNLCDAKPHTNIQKLDWAHTCHMLVPPHTACSTSRAATALPALVLACQFVSSFEPKTSKNMVAAPVERPRSFMFIRGRFRGSKRNSL